MSAVPPGTKGPEHAVADPVRRAQLKLAAGDTAAALAALAGAVALAPRDYAGWLWLGQALDQAGRRDMALRAWYQGLRRGQAVGQLTGLGSTPAPLRPFIQDIIAAVNQQRYGAVYGCLDELRAEFGRAALGRVEHAMAAYLGQAKAIPPSLHQRPKFLYFPGLPPGPYHDPFLHSWTPRLTAAFDAIRAEALAVLQGDAGLEDFLAFEPGQSKAGYLGGAGSKPSWDAFFFYRHGKRYDANHLRCPVTSAVLDEIELCEVEGQAPEICFSVLQPGTHIMKHHGVTNTRLVMHLPLVVPADCSLNVMGGGEHAWREREPMMFDDTFEHEAWNRSDQPRVILLMDCWNPHLTPDERIATRRLVELISKAENYPIEELAELAAAG